jgi:hypothetical protein
MSTHILLKNYCIAVSKVTNHSQMECIDCIWEFTINSIDVYNVGKYKQYFKAKDGKWK